MYLCVSNFRFNKVCQKTIKSTPSLSPCPPSRLSSPREWVEDLPPVYFSTILVPGEEPPLTLHFFHTPDQTQWLCPYVDTSCSGWQVGSLAITDTFTSVSTSWVGHDPWYWWVSQDCTDTHLSGWGSSVLQSFHTHSQNCFQLDLYWIYNDWYGGLPHHTVPCHHQRRVSCDVYLLYLICDTTSTVSGIHLSQYRPLLKGSRMGSWRETRLEYEIVRNRGRKYRENAKGQVGVHQSVKRYNNNDKHTRG